MSKKKKSDELEVVEEIVEVAEETIEATIEEPKQIKACSGKCEVMITDQFVKFEGKVYKRYDKLVICKELAQKAKRCKVL